MTGLDTNVLVRYLRQDDLKQSAAATRVIDAFTPQQPGFIPIPVLIEVLWVLRSAFKATRAGIAQTVSWLLQSDTLVVELDDQVNDAMTRYLVGSADFADYLIQRRCAANGCLKTLTFDRAAARSAGFALLPVSQPAQNPNDAPAPHSVSTPSTAKITAAMP